MKCLLNEPSIRSVHTVQCFFTLEKGVWKTCIERHAYSLIEAKGTMPEPGSGLWALYKETFGVITGIGMDIVLLKHNGMSIQWIWSCLACWLQMTENLNYIYVSVSSYLEIFQN